MGGQKWKGQVKIGTGTNVIISTLTFNLRIISHSSLNMNIKPLLGSKPRHTLCTKTTLWLTCLTGSCEREQSTKQNLLATYVLIYQPCLSRGLQGLHSRYQCKVYLYCCFYHKLQKDKPLYEFKPHYYYYENTGPGCCKTKLKMREGRNSERSNKIVRKPPNQFGFSVKITLQKVFNFDTVQIWGKSAFFTLCLFFNVVYACHRAFAKFHTLGTKVQLVQLLTYGSITVPLIHNQSLKSVVKPR